MWLYFGSTAERDEETTSNPGWRAQNDEVAPPKTFVALADALQDGIIVLDTDSEIQYANPAIERILGYGPQDLVGGSKLSIIPDRLQERHLNALDRYLETGERNIDWEYVELPGHHEVPLGISLNDFVFDDERYDDHGLSFTDASLTECVEDEAIDAVLSFDDDFDGLVERIDPTAVANR